IAACSLLYSKRSRLIFKASSLCTMSTSVVLMAGMPILARITASVLCVSKNGVSPLLDLIMVRLCLNPFCKVVHCYYKEFDFFGSLQKGSSYVYSPFVKWPRGYDARQFLLRVSWHKAVNLRTFLTYIVQLLPFLFPYEVFVPSGSVYLIVTKRESTFAWRFFTPICSANLRPAIRASYSASLLVAWNLNLMEYCQDQRSLEGCKTRSIELGEYDIHYRPRRSFKGQILADFIMERPEDDSLDTPMEVEEELPDLWTLFHATNNEAEYEALIAGLRFAEQMGVKNLQTNVDSRLVAKQVPRSENKKANALSKIASTSFAHLTKQVLVEELKEKYINEAEALTFAKEERDTWMATIYNYLTEGTLPTEKGKARAGIDIAGPFPEGPGKVKFLIVAMKYFTKWIEAKTVATIKGNQVKKFVWDNIVCRFGLPGEIISDNEKKFRDNPFKDWCKKLCVRQCFASVKHPQANGLVERANRSLREGIKARLDERSKDLIEELPHVLWAHHIMIKSSNRDTPFSLTYRTKAVIPAEIGMPTIRKSEVDIVQNDEALEINLDLLKERREQAEIREAKSKAKIEKYYNSKVRNTSFKPGDLVYKSNEASHAKESKTLTPKWEGPYEVTKALGNGAYKLRDRNGKLLP
nr:reverse transcriptase domain-containing protein [Tanacetum cinerariifolium]